MIDNNLPNNMQNLKQQIELLVDRCKEITSNKTAPGLTIPLITSSNLIGFVFDAFKGAYTPFANKFYKKEAKKELKDLFKTFKVKVSNPIDLLNLTDDDIACLHADFSSVLVYMKNELKSLSDFDITGLSITNADLSCDKTIKLAEGLTRSLIELGFHPLFLNSYFSNKGIELELFKENGIQAAIEAVQTFFQERNTPHAYKIYSPRLLQGGGEDRGFKSVQWTNIPENVQKAFSQHLASTLHIDPNYSSKRDDEGYGARFKKWEIECETLTLSKFLMCDVMALDPFSAAEKFREQYIQMKNIVYISRKGTGSTSNKNIHYQKRNTGKSPVQVQPISIITDQPDGNTPIILHDNAPEFPYQKLKNEFDRSRELMELFYIKCPVFCQLCKSYSNALEAHAQNDIDNIFRNLVVATELAFAKDNYDEIEAKNLLIKRGSQMLALDWIRDQFQSLAFLTKKRSPSKSEETHPLQIHIAILDDCQWSSYSKMINASELVKWRRERLLYVIHNSETELDILKNRFETELRILWLARHQYTHRANIFRESYFVALLLNLFRVTLDFRFSSYAIWLEWHAGRKIEGGANSLSWDIYERYFVDGWMEEFKQRVDNIENDFNKIKKNLKLKPEIGEIQQVVLGAGYAGLGVHPYRKELARPITVRSNT